MSVAVGVIPAAGVVAAIVGIGTDDAGIVVHAACASTVNIKIRIKVCLVFILASLEL